MQKIERDRIGRIMGNGKRLHRDPCDRKGNSRGENDLFLSDPFEFRQGFACDCGCVARNLMRIGKNAASLGMISMFMGDQDRPDGIRIDPAKFKARMEFFSGMKKKI